MTLTINGITGRSHIDGTLVQRRDTMERWTQEWLGATEGRETSLRTSPLSSPPQYALMETEEKTHSIHSIGDVKLVG